jgi:butyrate kinase
MNILVINPGSSSTKIAIFENLTPKFLKNIKHSLEDISKFNSISEQFDFRKKIILNLLKQEGISVDTFDAIIGRGGFIKPVKSGIIRTNEEMLKTLKSGILGEHASNLGGMLAHNIAKLSSKKIESFILDPVVVDEMENLARYSGIPEIPRLSIFHALNQKAVIRRYAKERGANINDLNIIVAHIGGGTSLGAHKKGQAIDVNNGLDGEGPFSTDRSGGVPIGQLRQMCFSNKYTHDEIKLKIKGKGGLIAYLGIIDGIEIENKIKNNDKKAEEVYEAMAYQVSKEIGALATVLEGHVDAIILTGGFAYSDMFINWIKKRVGFISEIVVYPGEDEMGALAEGAYYALKGKMPINEYI